MSTRKPKLPFPADDLQPATSLQDHYGNLIVNAEIAPHEAMLRQFVNAWGWKKDRVAMLADLKTLLTELPHD